MEVIKDMKLFQKLVWKIESILKTITCNLIKNWASRYNILGWSRLPFEISHMMKTEHIRNVMVFNLTEIK